MRIIKAEKFRNVIADLCIRANIELRKDVLKRLKSAFRKEKNPKAKKALAAIVENARVAKKDKLAICQDTGLVCVFIALGADVKITGDLKSAINKGVERGYEKGYFRNSVIKNPLLRLQPKSSPVVIHTDIVPGNKIKITVMPKGFGCENKSLLRMFNPTVDLDEIKAFIIGAVKSVGADACPPYIVGIGIGGTADYACFLAKRALLRNVTTSQRHNVTSKLEKDLLKEINKLKIGPMGLGGRATALAVNIEIYPTHIAGLPVAINFSCHALRSASAVI
ncbi:MAG: fumarate hydratase [Candidatus Omnitrophota bacterium]|nr:MAG: fumarate hydratase [Candidatus Omnitrophota bacterium]